ncbi:NTP transferase domain-containing protein [Aliarcobacter butzleri]|uniref:sugar phosphate nucleotidyltransferase n=1 Tax=Aliarcobacter butzleri TaxID=28197 RepID=UPI001EDC156F|nr:sugar phosphate nucleotidyltransferase [Aliarcobacter butzleri]MCG3675168.1 NTP transferase domain-containing protein [Aliarcobacter butzleri]MCG3683694.1 NTP transferase domain-containing protein [Aliarcobacter butzleri]MCG3688123.1 NTP transferase domain-containing protein [Aliarcobacter butzleri]MCG3697857.1 NTP transferase domain-containing protein [Aliarcobacter butzleri]MCG3699903.1 NTP transferase domain-containing protein [Aliarcobacter butzleri]
MERRAVILAGGKGTRLRPYTVVFPKPLMPIGDYPILEVIIRQLVQNSFTHITIAVNHQADLIKTFFGDGYKWGIKIDYSLEDKPLSTMAPLKLIKDLPDNFLVMNGDVLTDLNYGEFYEYHIKNENIFTISSYQREVKSEFGVLELDNQNNLVGFKEKPIEKYNVSMGIYMVSKKAVEFIPEDTFYGFDHLMLDLVKNNKNPSVKPFNGYWLDIGRPDDYEQAIEEFDRLKDKFFR